MMLFQHGYLLAVSFGGVIDSLLAAFIVAIITLARSWWWITSAKHRGMMGYFVGTAKVVAIYPDEAEFPRSFQVCYEIGYSKWPGRFRIESYTHITENPDAVGTDTCRGGWREDYVLLNYSKRDGETSSFGTACLKFTISDYEKKALCGSATGVSKGLFKGKDVVYAAEVLLSHCDEAPPWVVMYKVRRAAKVGKA